MLKNFRTFNLAVESFRECKGLPLKGDARAQLLRASRSVALNLAEGRGKSSIRDQRRYFYIALGSLRECQGLLILEGLEGSKEYRSLDSLGAHIYKLIENMG